MLKHILPAVQDISGNHDRGAYSGGRFLIFIGLVLFSLALWGGEYAQRKLWEPDEARYAYVAREMQQSGHWAVPYRHGAFYSHKPPLFFWMIQAASKLTGGEINQVSARIPSFLGTLMALWFTGLFAIRFLGPKRAWPAMLVLATTVLFWNEGGMGRMDSVLCGLEMAAIYLLYTADTDNKEHRRWLGYAMVGLAFAIKGPVGLVVPMGAYLVIRAVETRANPFKRHIWYGMLLALLFPAMWLLAAKIEGAPDAYFGELFYKQVVDRVTGETGFGKPRPFYFYLVQFPGDFFPWMIFIPACIAGMFQKGDRKRLWLLLGWALFVLVFFSLSSGKRNLYVLCAYPALAMIIAGGWDAVAELKRGWMRWTTLAAGLIFLLLGIAELNAAPLAQWVEQLAVAHGKAGKILLFSRQLAAIGDSFVPAGIVLLAGTMFFLFLYWRRGWSNRLLYIVAITFAVHYSLLANLVYPAINQIKTPVGAKEMIDAILPQDEPLLVYSETQEIVPFYAGRKALNATDPSELNALMHKQERGLILFRLDAWEDVSPSFRQIHLAGEFSVGTKEMVLGSFGRIGTGAWGVKEAKGALSNLKNP